MSLSVLPDGGGGGGGVKSNDFTDNSYLCWLCHLVNNVSLKEEFSLSKQLTSLQQLLFHCWL